MHHIWTCGGIALLLLMLGCGGGGIAVDDDTGDDDTAMPDDDTATPDDDDTATPDDDSAGDDDTATPDDDTSDDDTTPPADYAATGPWPVSEASDYHNPSGICFMAYTTFTPQGAPAAPVLVLTHGFARSQATMADLARHYASWGLPVITATVCNSLPLNSNPEQDAADLISLKQMLGGTDVLYAGHSSGGLRSVLAAVSDTDALAAFGLDLVDGDNLAIDAAPGLTVPLAGLAGESDMCNSDGNGLAVYPAASGSVLRVTEADHCDFEDPTDWLCTTLCTGTNDLFDDDDIHTTIRGLSTAWLVWRAGLDSGGEAWWTPGDAPYDDLLAAGAISAP